MLSLLFTICMIWKKYMNSVENIGRYSVCPHWAWEWCGDI